MKRLALSLALLLIPFFCFAQNEMGNDSIPVVDGKVVFSFEFHPPLSKAEIHKQLENWLTNIFLKNREIINLNDTVAGMIACRKMDVLEIRKRAFSAFSMNMRYFLVLEYKDNYSYQSAIDVKRTGAINTPPPFCAFTE